jgi:3-hydroxyisobutyrate dehydrogenase
MTSPRRLAWIGTGVMGASMCGHLIDAGHDVTVFTRTREKAQPLVDRGATWAESAAAAAARADVVFSIVGYPSDVREVYFGDQGVLATTRPGMRLVDMTTTSPTLASEIAAAAKQQGARAIDAPVSGGDVGARNRALSILVGGDEDAVQDVLPLLPSRGKTIIRQGPAGAGQHAKLCNQIVIAGTMIGVCESLLYGRKAGLDLATMLEVIRGGAAACWSLDNLAPRVLKGNFEPGFFVDHFVKDMGLALEESARMQIRLPGLELVHGLYRRLQAMGHGRKGTQALLLALEDLGAEAHASPRG